MFSAASFVSSLETTPNPSQANPTDCCARACEEEPRPMLASTQVVLGTAPREARRALPRVELRALATAAAAAVARLVHLVKLGALLRLFVVVLALAAFALKLLQPERRQSAQTARCRAGWDAVPGGMLRQEG